jgi:hypothetical protein
VWCDVSDPEIMALWQAAMAAHASQTRAREYVELQLTRARLLGLRASGPRPGPVSGRPAPSRWACPTWPRCPAVLSRSR